MTTAGGFVAALRSLYPAEISDAQVEVLWRHYELLSRWNRVLNLTRIDDLQEAVRRHYCESLFLADQLPAGAESMLDVGSGAGFPGIPVAVRRPAVSVTLCESHQRKAVFLREASRGLPNVVVAPRRARDVQGNFEWVVSRAVKWMDVARVATRHIALLLGESDAVAAIKDGRFRWDAPVRLPWHGAGYLVIGERCA